mgnify:CR=1 FL=1
MQYMLIADDNPDITDVLSAYARKEGYEPVLAADGEEALQQFRAKEISDAETEAQPTETQAEIKLRVKTKALVKDTEYTLKVYNLSENQKAVFKSSDPETASVDENGVIRGIANGTAISGSEELSRISGVKSGSSSSCWYVSSSTMVTLQQSYLPLSISVKTYVMPGAFALTLSGSAVLAFLSI